MWGEKRWSSERVCGRLRRYELRMLWAGLMTMKKRRSRWRRGRVPRWECSIQYVGLRVRWWGAGSRGTGVYRGAPFPSCPVESMAKSFVGLLFLEEREREREGGSCLTWFGFFCCF
jgi:hypothetical protein